MHARTHARTYLDRSVNVTFLVWLLAKPLEANSEVGNVVSRKWYLTALEMMLVFSVSSWLKLLYPWALAKASRALCTMK